MGRFKITREHSMDKDEVRAAAEDLAQDLKSRFNINPRWDGDTVSLKGSGVKGALTIADNHVDVKVELGLLASAFERPLKKEINRCLDEYLV